MLFVLNVNHAIPRFNNNLNFGNETETVDFKYLKPT